MLDKSIKSGNEHRKQFAFVRPSHRLWKNATYSRDCFFRGHSKECQRCKNGRMFSNYKADKFSKIDLGENHEI